MQSIYIIVWEGRDSDTEIWDTYPCYGFGFFTNEESARQKAKQLNKEEPGEYDEEAEATEKYMYLEIKPAKGLKDGKILFR